LRSIPAKLPAVLLRLNEIFRRAVTREIESRFGGERFDVARRFGVRIFDDKIDMRPLVNIVEKRECCGKDKYTDRSDQTKDRDQP